MELKYKRILLKLSGEALAGDKHFGIDFDKVLDICKTIKQISDAEAEIAIVVGGGNYWRGRENGYMNKINSDHIGMLATTMNALALKEALEQLNCKAIVQTAINMIPVAEYYVTEKSNKYLNEHNVVIFGAGTGSPYFSTDTAAALRAAEINADVIIKATNVDGVYTSDPKVDATAKKLDEINYEYLLEEKLKVMDLTAITLCMENNIPILVTNLNNPENIIQALNGEKIGTIITK